MHTPSSPRSSTEHPAVVSVVKEYVSERFPALPHDLADEEPLLDSGAVDSLGMLDIVMFIEERFAILIDDEELTGEHFETVATIAALVESKRG